MKLVVEKWFTICSAQVKYIILLFIFLGTNLSAQINRVFNEYTYGIGEFSSKYEILQSFNDLKVPSDFGLSIVIKKNETNGLLYLNLKEGEFLLKDFLIELNNYLEQHPKKVFPLFIDTHQNEKLLISVFKETGLLNKLFKQPYGERWPRTSKILKEHKQLIIFKKRNCNPSSEYINCFNSSLVVDLLSPNKQSDQKELLAVTNFTKDNEKNLPINWDRISTNTYSIDYLITLWKTKGKQPNFLFYSSSKYHVTIAYLCKVIYDYASINGMITYKSNVLQRVHWLSPKGAFTGGFFNFPYSKENNFTIEPYKKGYVFTPQKLNITDENKQESVTFTSHKLKINEGLQSAFDLEDRLYDKVAEQEFKQTAEFVLDNERGKVLKLNNKKSIQLNKVDKYGIVNKSFTMSIWFKLNETKKKYEYSIFGSDEEGYRKGLHVLIRYGKPLFGFYTNDCFSNTEIRPIKWYQLTVRYDILLQEQSIFLNGKRIAVSNSHPSFIGENNLLLGQSIKQDNYFNGYLDDFFIWDRALADQEIKWIYKNKVVPKNTNRIKSFWYFIASLIVVFSFLFIIIYHRKKKKKKITRLYKVDENKVIKNKIQLFHKFSFINEKGEDYANQFSPKIKELFLLLIIYSIKNNKGISTSELTQILWTNFPPAKAANNRGVAFNALKKIVTNFKDLRLSYEDKYWKLDLQHFTSDYDQVIHILNSKDYNHQTLFDLVKKGTFLSDVKSPWFVDFKSNFNFDLIDALLIYLALLKNKKEYNFILEISTYILKIDDLNIQGMYYQLYALTKLGSSNKAHFLFDKFQEKYQKEQEVILSKTLKEFLAKDVTELW